MRDGGGLGHGPDARSILHGDVRIVYPFSEAPTSSGSRSCFPGHSGGGSADNSHATDDLSFPSTVHGFGVCVVLVAGVAGKRWCFWLTFGLCNSWFHSELSSLPLKPLEITNV